MAGAEHAGMTLAAVFAAAWAASYGIGFTVTGWLRRGRVLDLPNERSSHAVPTPRGGGVGIMLAIIAGAAVVLAKSENAFGWMAIALTLGLAVVSFVDDRISLSWRSRISAQVVAATGATAALGATSGSALDASTLATMAALTFVFCGYANAFNFMDGINGMAATQALLTGIGTALVAVAAGLPASHPAVAISVLAAGAAAGFLPHNFPVARIFMGDVGSVPLGFLLAVLAAWVARDGGWWLLFPLALLHANFALDTAVTLVRRRGRGEVLHQAHREHFYQRATRGGRTHAQVTLTEAGLQVVTIVVAVGAVRIGPGAVGVAIPLVALVWAGFFWWCERVFKKAAEGQERGAKSEELRADPET